MALKTEHGGYRRTDSSSRCVIAWLSDVEVQLNSPQSLPY